MHWIFNSIDACHRTVYVPKDDLSVNIIFDITLVYVESALQTFLGMVFR